MLKVTHKGDFKNLEKLLNRPINSEIMSILNKYGQEGVRALASNTPVDSGTTAKSWGYSIRQNGNRIELAFTNSNTNKGVNIAIILQYGHATGTGGYVSGRDYINPAIQPIFDRIADSVWKEVKDR